MTETSPITASGNSASLLLGRKLDSIPFSAYHVLLIVVLGTVGFVEGYDLALGGSLLVLAKEPLHLTPEQVRWLVVAPTLLVVVGGFTASAISDRISRKTVMQIGVVVSTWGRWAGPPQNMVPCFQILFPPSVFEPPINGNGNSPRAARSGRTGRTRFSACTARQGPLSKVIKLLEISEYVEPKSKIEKHRHRRNIRKPTD